QIMADTLNKLISNNINNEENEVIKQYEYNLFDNFTEVSRSPFGIVRTAKWENSTIILKSITIDTNTINKGIVTEITNAINTNNMSIPDEATINRIVASETPIRLFINEAPHEKWIESKIIEGRINEYKIDEFEDCKLISAGNSSKVYKARFKNTKNVCALKIIEKNDNAYKEIENELKHIISIESHENIIKFHGITYKADEMDVNVVKYVLILEYANNGTLRDYLYKNSTKIEWEVKIQFAIQLVAAVKWLHTHNIVHGDLHPNNILIHKDIHEEILKLADFGLSRRVISATMSQTTGEIFGIIPYIDPQCFIEEKNQDGRPLKYKKNKKSDIYSIGVVLWEISSQKQAFENENTANLPSNIRNGLREKPIADTNHEYVAIYQRCWQGKQENRLSIEEVAMAFEDIIVQDVSANDSFDIYDMSEVKKYIDMCFKGIATDFSLDATITDQNAMITNQDTTITNQDTTITDQDATITDQDDPITDQNATLTDQDNMTIFVNNLYSTFSKLFNEGKTARNIIINFISKSDKTKEEVFQWLLTNDHPKYMCLRGLFYHWKIGTDENNANVVNLFVDAANKGDTIAKYFAGKCYAEGWNINKNKKKALEWYNKAAEKECAAAECVLGEYFYRLRKYTKAFDLLKRAENHGNLKALNTLGLCYQKGQGTVADAAKGFKSFEKAAVNGLSVSQYELGNCYEYGLGTRIDLNKALEWYKKATKVNDIYQIHRRHVEIKMSKNK
ncbi:31487_t:CDS:2, partial [Gigaspora margarita]